MPVYNAERFLEASIQSVLNQSFTDFEVILSDNASNDRTPEICAQYVAQDRRVRYYRADYNRGAGWNHKRVLELATGQYFKWQAHDDICAPSMMEKCIAALEADKHCVLAHARTTYIDECGKIIGNYNLDLRTDSKDVAVRFSDLVMSYHECYEIFGVIRRSVLERTGPQPSIVHGDGHLLAHLALYGPYRKIPEALFYNREHSARSSRTLPSRLRGHRLRLTRHVQDLPSAEWWDATRARRITYPQWQQANEYLRMVRCAPLAPQDRKRCYRVVLRWMLRDRRRFVKDLLIAADQVLYNLQSSKGGKRMLGNAEGGEML